MPSHGEALAPLEELAAAGAWGQFAFTFFRDMLSVPVNDLEALRAAWNSGRRSSPTRGPRLETCAR